MSETVRWLESGATPRDSRGLYDLLRGLGAVTGESEDAAEYMSHLLQSLEFHCLSSRRWNSLLVGADAVETLSTSPGVAAKTMLDQLRAVPGISGGVAAGLAEAYHKSGQGGAAELCARAAFLSGDRSQVTLGLLLLAALGEKRLEAARELSDLQAARHGDGPETLYGRARLAEAEGSPQRAAQLAKELVARYPGYRPAWELLADSLLSSRKWAEAAEVWSAMPENLRDTPEALYRLAKARYGAGDKLKARECLSRSMEALERGGGFGAPGHVGMVLELADLELELSSTERAVALLQKCIPLAKGHPGLTRRLAKSLMAAGMVDQAKALLEELLEGGAGDPETLALLGRIHFDAGNDQLAFDLLQAAVEADQGQTGAMLLLALLCLRNRQFELAVELSGVVAALDPTLAAKAWLVTCDALRFSGNPSQACEALLEAGKAALGDPLLLAEITKRLQILQKK